MQPSNTARSRKDRLSHLRRTSILESSSVNLRDVSLQDNNDEEERNNRRQLRALDDQEKHLNSPSTPSRLRLVLGTALSGLSNEELSEHYKECVRLSTENKITKKNAFQLHLIDYMADTVKKSGDDMNFQVASCALDASAKIYGYRVDALEADTCKLASELGRTHKSTENDMEVDRSTPDSEEIQKKKKKAKKSSKIELNLKNITLDKIEQRFEADSLRNQLTSGFEEQGAVAGLFLYNLSIIDDSCQLALDFNRQPPALDTQRSFEADERMCLSSFKSLFQKTISLQPSIDKAFQNFDFKNLDMDEFSKDDGFENNVPEPVNDNGDFVFNQEPEEDYDNQGADPMDADDYDEEEIVGVAAGEKRAGNPVLRLENINDTIGFLTAKPSEYTYYDDAKLMSAWTGPNRWRFLPFNRRAGEEARDVQTRKRKARKAPQQVDIDAEPFELIHNEAKNILTKAALHRWSANKNDLPLDHHYEIQNLGKSMLNSILWIRSIKKIAKPIDADLGEGGYNYDNPADKSNYCGAEDDSDNDDRGGGASPAVDFHQSQDMEFSFTQQPPTQNLAMPFTGDNLVQQPYKIDKPYLAYEKTAKKIDAKKIKKAMWTILSKSDDDSSAMPGMMQFSKLYKEIPKHLSETAAKNLSVPIALVTFLHLSNEKVLHLTKQADLKNFGIQQG